MRSFLSSSSTIANLSEHSQLDSMYMTRLSSSGTLYPDCLPVDEGISALSLAPGSSVLRVGGSNGSIAWVLGYPDDLRWCQLTSEVHLQDWRP